jgi:capsular exopolysaccharide synthesis family protein
MSRNYELMQEMEKSRVLFSSRVIEPAFPVPADTRGTSPVRDFPGDLSLGLVERVFLQQTHEPPRMVVFAAVEHGNGCSEIAASVAANLAQNLPGAVCLVEANFRSPSLPLMLGTTNYHGLTDALLEPGGIRSFMKTVWDETVWLISSGPVAANSPNLLTSERMRARSMELRKEFDFVIVDAPPLSGYGDAIALGKLSDGVVVVLEAESTRREAARVAVENLRASGIPVLGAVLNKRTFPIPERIYRRL